MNFFFSYSRMGKQAHLPALEEKPIERKVNQCVGYLKRWVGSLEPQAGLSQSDSHKICVWCVCECSVERSIGSKRMVCVSVGVWECLYASCLELSIIDQRRSIHFKGRITSI